MLEEKGGEKPVRRGERWGRKGDGGRGAAYKEGVRG